MPGINSIIAAFSPSVNGLNKSTGKEPVDNSQINPITPAPGPKDSFTQGEHWKNKATGSNDHEQGISKNCNCGSCPACAVKQYAKQEKSEKKESLPAPEDSNKSTGQSPEPSGQEEVKDKNSPENTEKNQEKSPAGLKKPNGEMMSQEEKMVLKDLQGRDTAIRAHEAAHLAAAGQFARSGASFSYKKGPDGRDYAVGGEVMIDTSRESSPEATIAKMRTVRAAALAPANPSPQDRKVAAAATTTASDAATELRTIKLEEAKDKLEIQRKQTVKEDEEIEEQSSLPNAGEIPDGSEQKTSPEISDSEVREIEVKEPIKFTMNRAAKAMNNIATYQYGGLSNAGLNMFA
jgi:hypothetical protein